MPSPAPRSWEGVPTGRRQGPAAPAGAAGRSAGDRASAVVLVALAVVLLGCAMALQSLPAATASQSLPAATASAVGELPGPVSVTAVEIDAEAPPPRSLAIERLGVSAPVTGLRVQADGALAVPEDFDAVGWHRGGTAPGDRGPAVLVGHVDSFAGPAVFFRLRELVPGDRVHVGRADGSAREFEVYGAETVAKTEFPTQRVYGGTAEAELRLVTCGGAFDERTRHYTDNHIVYLRMVPAVAP